MSKGSSKSAQAHTAMDDANATKFGAFADQDRAALFPFLKSEMNNPQGFGPEGVSKLETMGGQATAGELGQATEAAQLNAARTGNTAAAPGIIGDATRAGMKQQSDTALQVGTANEKLKELQRQAGAGGLGATQSEDVNAVLSSLGLGNQSVENQTRADASNPFLDVLKTGMSAAGTGTSGIG